MDSINISMPLWSTVIIVLGACFVYVRIVSQHSAMLDNIIKAINGVPASVVVLKTEMVYVKQDVKEVKEDVKAIRKHVRI